jgi:tape measure domain-containing protein
MAGSNNAMEVRFRANMRDLERELQRLTRINSRAAQQMADAHKRAAKAAESAWNNNAILSGLQRQIGAMGPQLRAMSATIAGLFAGHEALQAAETWTRFTNSLKVAGVEGNNLKVVQDQLYESAIANGVAIEPLGTLYSRLSQSAGELGASQSQLLKFSNGVTAALRVQGGDAASASGALLQMSQALAGGVVHAEEFNSINEGARPILEAVARGNEKYGGSVAKLRAAMLDGKLSSKEFFDNFLKGSASLEAQAAKAPLTVAQAMTNLHTAFTKFVGETDATYGVTERIGQAVGALSQNLDVLAKSIAVVGALYAATFIPALGRASALIVAGSVATIRSTAASIADTAALITRTAAIYNVSRASAAATVASRGLAAALAMMGGPIGIAIMAIGAAIAYLGTSSVNAALEALAAERDEKLRQLEKQVGEKSIKDADAAKVKATIEATYQQKVANAEAERKLEVDQRAREQAQAGADLANEAARIEADNLTEAARYERDTRKRHAMERSALAKKQAAEDAAFRLQQDQLALDREKAGWTKEVIDRLRRDAEANREAQKAGERTSLDRDQQHDRPTTIAGQIDDYAKSFGTLNEQLGNVAAGAIDNISRGLTDAVMGAKSFKDAFADMAKAVIAQLIEMAIRFAIFEAIGMAFGMPGLGRAALGMSSSTPIARNAKGTDRFAGGLSMVGENGPELAYLPAGTQIAPNNLLRNALSGGVGAASTTNNNYYNTTVNANDSVLTETVKSWIDQSQAQTMVAVERKIGRGQTDAQRNRLVRK